MLALYCCINATRCSCTQYLVDFWWTDSTWWADNTWPFMGCSNFELLVLNILIQSIVFQLTIFFESVWLRNMVEPLQASNWHWWHIWIVQHFILPKTCRYGWRFMADYFVAASACIWEVGFLLRSHSFVLAQFWNLIIIMYRSPELMLILYDLALHLLYFGLVYLPWRLCHLLHILILASKLLILILINIRRRSILH